MSLVLVTGVSGYIAGQLAKELVSKGYRVRGTVRSLADPQKVDHLRKELPNVELVEADLLKDGSFDNAVKGTEIVFHTASPFLLPGDIKDPLKDVVEPAVNGTLNVLKSVEKDGNVKRVVLTSSIAAIAGDKPEDYVFSDKDWNLDSKATESSQAYRYSKRAAEEAAWDFQKGKKWSLVTINPSFVTGKPLSARTDSASVKVLKNILEGTPAVTGNMCFGRVYLGDVVQAHIRAAENPTAHGRYLVTSPEGISSLDVCNILTESGLFSKYPIPTKESEPVLKRQKFDASRTYKELGFEYTPIKTAVIEMAQGLIDLGIVKKRD
eukprot:TRINITY_DN2922_c0_g1_i1.p1 TRINITY_DN2922_c0_g1~~TRINITY_DN2922_c0_g1_i1.p1  ORF type:complete len:323 (+),score=95.34 TRINITY_DN2922_c0_g1_i1:65-1033(+)